MQTTCKLFISQPMADKSEEQIKAERERAIARAQEHIDSFPDLKGTTIEVIDSFITDAPEDAKPLWYLGKSLELMADADIVFFIEGWNKYRGCRIENAAAHEYLEPQGTFIIEELDGALPTHPEG